ncbi:MAG: Tolloid-like protein 1 [Clostridia bacterium]|nr:Tolloid-like protein 1 [Clostridia bacterium]
MIISKKCSIAKHKKVHIKFLDNNTKYINAIKKYAPQWETYLQFKFVFDNHPDSPIQISFNEERVHHSCVGVCNCHSTKFPGTMTFGFNDNTSEESMRRVILHEFGHAIGLKHEHQHPDCPIVWNKNTVYEYYKTKHSWSQEKVDRFILNKIDRNDTRYKFYEYDSSSIMHYSVKEELTVGNFAVPYNTQLSEKDKKNWRSYILSEGFIPNLTSPCGVICLPPQPYDNFE